MSTQPRDPSDDEHRILRKDAEANRRRLLIAARELFAERGLDVTLHDIAARAPWLLAGAKTLSYAINKAVLREAARRGADDVLFVSSDGYVLEGPSSTLIAKFGNRIWTPSTALGILPEPRLPAVKDSTGAASRRTQ